MMFARLIAIMTAAASGLAPAFANAEDIALSLVHAKGRVDIPISAVSRAEVHATVAVRNAETGEVHEYPDPHVVLCFTEDIKERVCRLTQQIVGQPMDVVIDCETVAKPVVREPPCTRACFSISMFPRRIRRGSNKTCAPSS